MKNLTIITLDQPHITDFSAARNKLLEQVQTDWVLFLDADESLSPALEQEISKAITSSQYEAYYLPRQDKFLDQVLRYGETGHASFIRLGKRTYGKWVRPVHELWEGRGNPAHGSDRVGRLKHPILHEPHQGIATFLAKIDYYSTLESTYRFREGRRAHLWQVFVYPLAKFKLNYFARFGFADGVPGLIHALMMSFHSYLTWSKLYLLCRKK